MRIALFHIHSRHKMWSLSKTLVGSESVQISSKPWPLQKLMAGRASFLCLFFLLTLASFLALGPSSLFFFNHLLMPCFSLQQNSSRSPFLFETSIHCAISLQLCYFCVRAVFTRPELWELNWKLFQWSIQRAVFLQEPKCTESCNVQDPVAGHLLGKDLLLCAMLGVRPGGPVAVLRSLDVCRGCAMFAQRVEPLGYQDLSSALRLCSSC